MKKHSIQIPEPERLDKKSIKTAMVWFRRDLRAQDQAAPDLLQGQGVDQRVQGIVDFNQMFKFHRTAIR